MQMTQERKSEEKRRGFKAYPVLLSSAIAFSGLGCATLAKLLPWIGGGTYAPSTTQISSSSTVINVASNSGNTLVNNGNGAVRQNNYHIGSVNYTVVSLPPGSFSSGKINENAFITPNPTTPPAGAPQSSTNPPPTQNGTCNLKDGPALACGQGIANEVAEGQVFSIDNLHFSFDVRNGMNVLQVISPDCKEKNQIIIPFNQKAQITMKDNTAYEIAPLMDACQDSKCDVQFMITHLCH